MESPIFLRGEIDFSNVDDCLATLRANAATPAGDLLVDCMDVEFIDAAGVGALVRVNNELRAQGRYLRLIHPAPLLRRMLDVYDLNELLDEPTAAVEPIR